MKKPGIRAIRIVKGDTVFHVHGELAGAEGVYLAAQQVRGLYDAPIRTTYKTGAFQEGSTHRHTKKLHRDLELGFHVKETGSAYELNDSLFRQIFEHEEDRWDTDPSPTTIEVETELSGLRKLDVLMYEGPEFVPDLDPLAQEFGNCIFKLRAPDPMWYEDAVLSSFEAGTSSGSGQVIVSNPTDNILYHKWILTPAEWTLPDYSWQGARGERAPGGDDAARELSGIAITSEHGGAVIDLDRNELMYRAENDTNLLAQLGSTKIFNHAVPPYTPETYLPVSYASAPGGGAIAQLRMQRRWSRPWGLELASTLDLSLGVPRVVRFSTDYTYQIPPTADTIDVILIGGGGGGDGGISVGHGGLPGQWGAVTLVRGTDIPWETEFITGTVGAGGMHGGILQGAPSNGGTTTATATGMTTVTADGGIGGGNTALHGETAGSLTVNGRVYEGGARTWLIPRNGNIPGGGGSSGLPLGPGGNGARGQAWFVAYNTGTS